MEQNEKPLNNFDRTMAALDGIPDGLKTSPANIRVVTTFGVGSHMFIVQTFRHRETGDTIFLEHVAEGVATRLVIPPRVADTIARQREALNSKSRSKAMRAVAEDRAARGLKPGFMKAKRK